LISRILNFIRKIFEKPKEKPLTPEHKLPAVKIEKPHVKPKPIGMLEYEAKRKFLKKSSPYTKRLWKPQAKLEEEVKG